MMHMFVEVKVEPDISENENSLSNSDVHTELYEAHQVKEKIVIGQELMQSNEESVACIVVSDHSWETCKPEPDSELNRHCFIAVENDTRTSQDTKPSVLVDIIKEEPENEETKSVVKIVDNKNKYTCDICNKMFHARSSIIRHLFSHSGKKYACDSCEKKFALKKFFLKHKLIHKTDVRKKTTCEICNKIFASKYSLSRHILTHTGEKPYSCELCDMKFRQKERFVDHMARHAGKRLHACDKCNMTFTWRAHLYLHRNVHTGKRYICDVCNKEYTNLSSLGYHKRTHDRPLHQRASPVPKPYSCATCNHVFREKSHLLCHERIHTGEKPFSCAICEKKFRYKSSLVGHLRGHTGHKPYACQLCSKRFTTSSCLTQHKRLYCPLKIEKKRNCICICDICNREFSIKRNFIRHMLTHKKNGLY